MRVKISMISICICDDEPALCKQVQQLLSFYANQKKVEINITVVHSVDTLRLQPVTYDVIFLDIRFDKQDLGIETAKFLRQKGNKAYIIFMTSLPDYFSEGYKVDAFRYIVKPIQENELFEAMDSLIEREQQILTGGTRITVKTLQGIITLLTEEIIGVQSEPIQRKRKIITIHNKEGILTTEPLQSLYNRLPKNQFIYTHQRHVVNIRHVMRISGDFIILDSNTSVPIGRKYRSDFFIAFGRYNGEMI